MADQLDSQPHYERCGICWQLGRVERGLQKICREHQDTFLPAAADKLRLARDLKPGGGSRLLELWQCPECATYYLYQTDYEFLIGGSEDEQELTRLTAREVLEYTNPPGDEPAR